MRTLIRQTALVTLGLAIALCPIKNASASLIGTATFTTPTGTVNATDSIPVYVTLALDPSSDPLITDFSGNVISGYSLSDVEANMFGGLPDGVDPTSDPLSAVMYQFIQCSGTFTSVCTSGPPYDFQFGPSITSNLDLEPGNSINFLLGTFTPTGGVAPAGIYTFLNGGVEIDILDNAFQDPNNPGFPLAISEIALETAQSGSIFTRDVVGGAPEPGSGALLLAGFALLGGIARRKLSVEAR